jgi:hypothetical protein
MSRWRGRWGRILRLAVTGGPPVRGTEIDGMADSAGLEKFAGERFGRS